MPYRKDILAATTSAVSWEIDILNEYDLKRIVLIFATAPTTYEDLTVTLKSNDGDCLLRTVEVVGVSNLSIENIGPVASGDKLLVEYTNTDGVSISGYATVEV